jgi:hypothetical protein
MRGMFTGPQIIFLGHTSQVVDYNYLMVHGVDASV